jgi:hypothetical protein
MRGTGIRASLHITKKRRDLESHARTTTRRMEEPYINPSPVGGGSKIESLSLMMQISNQLNISII